MQQEDYQIKLTS